jgi:mRNA interferase HigB
MHIVAMRNLEKFWQLPKGKAAEGALKAWFAEAKAAKWASPQDVKKQYASASIIANNRIVFNIKGNDYRLIVAVAYQMQYVYVKFVGTHADYDKVDAACVDQFSGE